MDRANLLDRVGVAGDDRLLLAKLLDRAVRAQNRNSPAATDFLSPRQQALASDLLRLAEIRDYQFSGGFEGAERKLILFLPGWMDPADAVPPIRCIRAEFRTEDALSHRDLLGSLMGLGIVREKIGDILVSPGGADLMALDSVADFLLQNWDSAGRAKLRVSEIDPAHIHFPEIRCQTVRDTVSSLRLDAVAAAGFRMARGKAAELIAAGRVEVNWTPCTKPDRLLSPGDTITARGFGKMELTETGSLTRKGRLSIVIKRYI